MSISAPVILVVLCLVLTLFLPDSLGDMGVGKSCLLHQFTEKKCRWMTASVFCVSVCMHACVCVRITPLCPSLLTPASHGRLSSYDWSRIWNENSGSIGSEDQAPDLGHSGAGEI